MTSRLAYPVAMETLPALSHEVWKRTPPEAQAYIRALEMRVATLEGGMQALHEQLQQTSRILHVRLRATRYVSLHTVLGVSAVVVVNRAIRAIRVPCSRWRKSMRWWSSSPSSVPAATPPYRATIPRRGGIK